MAPIPGGNMESAKTSPLLTAVETLFVDTDCIVIAAFEAQKLHDSGESTGSQLIRSLGGGKADSTLVELVGHAHGVGVARTAATNDQLRSVVLAFTVKRSLTDRGFISSIHVARSAVTGHDGSKDAHRSRLELRKSYPLKSLHDLRITTPARSSASQITSDGQQQQSSNQLQRQHSLGQQHQVVEIRCASHHAVPEHRGSYVLVDSNSAMFLASLVVQLLRQQDAVLPTISGVSVERLDSWWSSHKDEVTQDLSSFALEVVTPGAILVGRAGDGSAIPVSDKEASELEELLQLFELGLGDSHAFATALQEEAAALEAANVYAILESGPLVDGVIGQLRRTQTVLDDLDESLKVFDFKLRHMRDDIAAIEASNNSLERQARHNKELMLLLEGLLGGLHLDQSVIRQLEQTLVELQRLPTIVSAAWQLHQQRVWLTGAAGHHSLNPLLTDMRVVKEAQAELEQITASFVSKAVSFLLALVGQLVGEAMAEANRIDKRVHKVCPPHRPRLHNSLSRCAALIQVLAVLDTKVLLHLQQSVSAELNSLLRRDVRTAAAELRRGAAAELETSSRSGGGDYSLSKERGSSASAAARSNKHLPRMSMGSSGGGSDSVSEWAADPTDYAGPAAAAGTGATKRAAFLDGSANSLPLHEAVSQLLEGFLPYLADEAAFFADILLMYRGDEDQLRLGPTPPPGTQELQHSSSKQLAAAADAVGRTRVQQQQQRGTSVLVEVLRPPGCALTAAGVRAVETMMAGLDAECSGLVDLASRSHQVLLLPLLAITRSWQQRLSGAPHASPLVSQLAALAAKIQGHWTNFKLAQIAAVDQYDARSKMGLQQGIKHIRVLPLVSQFCLIAHDLEVALVDGFAAAGAGAAQEQQQQQGAEEDGSTAQLAAGQFMTEGAAAAAACSVRQDADSLYDELCPRLLSRLERVAASDAKYAERCRLENYAFLGEALRSLAATVPALQQHWQVAESRREAALSSYVTVQLQYSKFWKLLEFADKLDKLLQVVSPPEVSFQKDCSPAEVRSLIRSTMSDTDKKLEAMVARVRKHLGGGSIFNKAWAAIKDQLIARYEHLEWLLEQCYPTTPLRPAPEELRELFKITSAG